MIFRSKSKIPGWFVGLVVLVTGLLTFWTMLQRREGQLWATETATYPQRVTQVFAPATATNQPRSYQQVAQPQPAGMRQVASTRAVPTIQAGVPAPHGSRGACTLCHLVVDKVGAAIPIIPALASLPHQFRGVCTNCHQVKGAATATTPAQAPLVAATAAAPGSAGAWSPVAGIRGQPLQVPKEGSWLGMNLVPITPLIQQQYSLPQGINGLAVAEVEAQAAAAGVQPGDVLMAVNGRPVTDLSALQQATASKTLAGGTLDLLRQGQLLRLVVGGASPAQPQAPLPAQQPATAPLNAGALQPQGALPGYVGSNGQPAPQYQGQQPSPVGALIPNPYPSAGGVPVQQ